MIFCNFYKVNNLFLHQSYLISPLTVKINLIKNAKNHFLLLKKLKNTESAQLCANIRVVYNTYTGLAEQQV